MPELLAIEIPTLAFLHLKANVYREMIDTFHGYTQRMPQHREYYDSIITHVEVFLEETLKLIETLEESEQCQPH